MELEKLIRYRDKAISEMEKAKSYIAKHSGIKDTDYEIYEIRHQLFLIRTLEAKIANYNKKIAIVEAKQGIDIPETLKKFADSLVENWNQYDFKMREFYKQKLSEIGFIKFGEKYSKNKYDLIFQSDDAINTKNKKCANDIIIKLIHQTMDKIGKITNATCLTLNRDNNGFPTINGYVTGEKGKVDITSILAGGYNIQRLHVRVLVKSI